MKRWIAWILLLWGAAALFFVAPNWDGGLAAHPDEIYVLDAATQTAPWGDVCQTMPNFSYGALPVNLLSLIVRAAPDTDPLYAVRLATGLWAVLFVAVSGAWGKALAGRRGGWLAAMLAAVAPFTIQQAHFTTVDLPAAAFSAAAVLAMAQRRPGRAGVMAGLALACKASLGWVVIPLAVGLMGRAFKSCRRAGVGRAVLGLGGAFILGAPWMMLDPVACFQGPWIQAQMVAGRLDYPYVQQFAGTVPFLYPLVQMALWGVGPATVLAGLAALGRAAWRFWEYPPAVKLGWVWTVVFFGMTAGVFVKFPRYLLPLYPLWVAWAARAWLGASGRSVWRGWIGLLLTVPLGMAQLSIYTQPHSWIAASQWIYANVPAGSQIVVEDWDHPLPVPLVEGSVDQYQQVNAPVFDSESPEKAARLAELAQSADVIVLASPRGYGAMARQPERYESTLAWYREILQAPDRVAVVFDRCPRWGPVALSDDPLVEAGMPAVVSLAERCGASYVLPWPLLDESFRVYDAPLVILLVRR